MDRFDVKGIDQLEGGTERPYGHRVDPIRFHIFEPGAKWRKNGDLP